MHQLLANHGEPKLNSICISGSTCNTLQVLTAQQTEAIRSKTNKQKTERGNHRTGIPVLELHTHLHNN